MLFGLLGRALLLAAGAAVVAGIVIYISGIITEEKLREKLKEKGIESALINDIDRCTNVIKLTDMDTDETIEVHGDDIDYDIEEDDLIFVY